VQAGLTKTHARNVCVSLFSLLEGAFMLARATRDHTHIRTAGRTVSGRTPVRGIKARDGTVPDEDG
jgi:hypothetical protein